MISQRVRKMIEIDDRLLSELRSGDLSRRIDLSIQSLQDRGVYALFHFLWNTINLSRSKFVQTQMLVCAR